MSKLYSLTNTFVKQIEEKIISGEWSIGQRLPTARELSELYGVSRSVINAGMVELKQKGFIKIVPRKWTEVIDYHKEGTIKVLESIMEYDHEKIDDNLFQSVLQARMLVEKECAFKAADNHTKEDIERLQGILDNEKEYIKNQQGLLEKIVINDFAFHHAIAVASDNAVYPLILKSFEPMSLFFTRQFYRYDNVLNTVSDYHKKIFDAINNRESSKASELMAELLAHGETIMKSIKKV
ncbi:MAG: FadR family transcriptional regulator [Clostridia bacterium]|nr:FadR family transcriptional regulator [Clostridia bacterium]